MIDSYNISITYNNSKLTLQTAFSNICKMPLSKKISTFLIIISLAKQLINSDFCVIVRPTDSDPSICRDHATCDTLSNFISNNSAILGKGTVHLLKGIHNIIVNASIGQLKIEGKTNTRSDFQYLPTYMNLTPYSNYTIYTQVSSPAC